LTIGVLIVGVFAGAELAPVACWDPAVAEA
jgi:hypothetical protein